ncbi:MAG: hypothetical protein EOM31_13300 [Bacteroidia bacterium]|nr:hypothetical protein [Bacteroidia bacterium]
MKEIKLQWIPVKEALPELPPYDEEKCFSVYANKKCLVTNIHGQVFEGRYCRIWLRKKIVERWEIDGTSNIHPVIAWMPMPPAYEEEGEQE